MAEFLISYKKTNINEGGFVDDPSDSGGMTYSGISRVNFPHWEGWKEIDELKEKVSNFPACLKLSEDLPQMIEKFYKENFWNKINGDEIPSQELANDIYDASVNMGVHAALELLKIS